MISGKQAVQHAKQFLLELYDQEELSDLGLEEVGYDPKVQRWFVTLGFVRPWDKKNLAMGGINTGLSAARSMNLLPPRTYKVVTLDEEGTPLSIRNREGIDVG